MSLVAGVDKNSDVMSVSTTPGQMQLTRILLFAYSKAQHFVNKTKAAFDAEYASALKFSYALIPADDAILIIAPPFFCRCGIEYFVA
jgi:hypothetical protein